MTRERYHQAILQVERCYELTVNAMIRCSNPERMADLCGQLDRLDDGLILLRRLQDRSGESFIL